MLDKRRVVPQLNSPSNITSIQLNTPQNGTSSNLLLRENIQKQLNDRLGQNNTGADMQNNQHSGKPSSNNEPTTLVINNIPTEIKKTSCKQRRMSELRILQQIRQSRETMLQRGSIQLSEDNDDDANDNQSASGGAGGSQSTHSHSAKKQQEQRGMRSWRITRITYLIKRFIVILKQRAAIEGFGQISQKHLDLINDMTYFRIDQADGRSARNGYNSLISLFAVIFTFLWERVVKRISVFRPDSDFIILWRILQWVVLISQILATPIKLSFYSSLDFTDGATFYLLVFCPSFVCLFDIVFGFNTAYYEEGEIIYERIKIIRRYLSLQFWIDLISTITLFLYDIQVIQVVLLVRLYQIGQIANEVDERFQMQQRFPAIWMLLKLVMQVIITAHFCACTFHFIAQAEIEAGDTDTWLHSKNLIGAGWGERYLNSLYFTFITMATVGYGDITPNSLTEKIYVMIVTFLSCGQFGYVINTIGQIFLEMAQKQANFRAKKFEITSYMRSRSIKSDLQIKVIKYLDYIQQKEDEDPEKGLSILSTVSKKLREEVYQDFFGKAIMQCKLFKFNFSKECLLDLALLANEALYAPGELIYSKGEEDRRIFFIFRGIIQLIQENNQNNETYIQEKGDYLGQQSFFTGMLRESSARSVNVSHILYVNFEDFRSILKRYPLDYEKFCMIKDNILFGNQILNQKCYPCDRYKHSILNCPFMHCIKNKEFIIKKLNFPTQQERINIQRPREQKNNTLKRNNQTREALKRLRKRMIEKIQQKTMYQERLQQFSLSPFKQHSLSALSDSIDEDSDDGGSSPKNLQKHNNLDKEFFTTTAKITYANGQWDIQQDSENSIEYSNNSSFNNEDEENSSQLSHRSLESKSSSESNSQKDKGIKKEKDKEVIRNNGVVSTNKKQPKLKTSQNLISSHSNLPDDLSINSSFDMTAEKSPTKLSSMKQQIQQHQLQQQQTQTQLQPQLQQMLIQSSESNIQDQQKSSQNTLQPSPNHININIHSPINSARKKSFPQLEEGGQYDSNTNIQVPKINLIGKGNGPLMIETRRKSSQQLNTSFEIMEDLSKINICNFSNQGQKQELTAQQLKQLEIVNRMKLNLQQQQQQQPRKSSNYLQTANNMDMKQKMNNYNLEIMSPLLRLKVLQIQNMLQNQQQQQQQTQLVANQIPQQQSPILQKKKNSFSANQPLQQQQQQVYQQSPPQLQQQPQLYMQQPQQLQQLIEMEQNFFKTYLNQMTQQQYQQQLAGKQDDKQQNQINKDLFNQDNNNKYNSNANPFILNEINQDEIEEFYLYNFDKICIFKNYFPLHNITVVCNDKKRDQNRIKKTLINYSKVRQRRKSAKKTTKIM